MYSKDRPQTEADRMHVAKVQASINNQVKDLSRLSKDKFPFMKDTQVGSEVYADMPMGFSKNDALLTWQDGGNRFVLNIATKEFYAVVGSTATQASTGPTFRRESIAAFTREVEASMKKDAAFAGKVGQLNILKILSGLTS